MSGQWLFQILRIMILLIGIYQPYILCAPNEGNVWYFGNFSGLDFNTTPVTVLGDGQLNSNEGCISVSKPDGNLLLYSNGRRIWNSAHEVIVNGGDIAGDPSSTQAGVFLLKPESANIYYLFTVDMQAGQALSIHVDLDGRYSGLRYSEIDVTGADGKGIVLPGKKNLLLADTTTESIIAIRHANGKDYWILVHGWNNRDYYAFLVNEQGVSTTPVISVSGPLVGGGSYGSSAVGYMRSNARGDRIAETHPFESKSVVVSRFDNRTGKVSDGITLSLGLTDVHSIGPYGVEFSPCSNYLYVSEMIIMQPDKALAYPERSFIHRYDMENNLVHKVFISVEDELLGALQLGKDGRIYCASVEKALDIDKGQYYTKGGSYLHTIESPSREDAVFNYRSVRLSPGLSQNGLPSFVNDVFHSLDIRIITPEGACVGEPVTLEAKVAWSDSVRWILGDGSVSGQLSVAHRYAQAGKYTVQLYRYLCGQADIVQAELEIHDLPVFDIADITVCEGKDSVVAAPVTGDSYLWSNGAVQPFISIADPGIYTLAVTRNGCTYEDQFVVSHRPLPVTEILLPDGKGFCRDSTVRLNAATGPGYLFRWFLDGQLIPGADQSQLEAGAPGEYRVEVSDGTCAGLSDPVRIDAFPEPVAVIRGQNRVCAGDSVQLTVELTPGTYRYTWFKEGQPYGSDQEMLTVYEQGWYNVVVTTAEGCPGSSVPFWVEAIPSPDLSLKAPQWLCVHSIATLEAVTDADEIYWNTGSKDPVIEVTGPGTYTVTASLGECKVVKSVEIEAVPAMEVHMPEDTVICSGSTWMLTPVLAHVDSLTWQDGSTSNSYLIDKAGRYTLSVHNRCSEATYSVAVEMQDCACLVALPGAFTPNRDGINDVLRPVTQCEITHSLFQVYNRWGELLFESSDHRQGWDGYYRQSLQPNDGYIYYFRYISPVTGKTEELKGVVMLLK